MTNLTSLSDVAGLEAALAESCERPVLIFKHSRSCGISCEALDQLREHVEGSTSGASYKMITVQSHRDVANEVSARLGIRHETPQAILVRHGQAVWSASHFRITAPQLDAVLQASALSQPA